MGEQRDPEQRPTLSAAPGAARDQQLPDSAAGDSGDSTDTGNRGGPSENPKNPRSPEDLDERTASDAPLGSGYVPDEEALRGTRFEFGGRRPFSFPPKHQGEPQPAGHSPSQRPLPGIGTVALGKVARIVHYGAFVDFLGFRGLVHISQLMPGFRVDRVEDIVQVGDEVAVRVIAVDPERRHLNLALVPTSAAVTAQPPARFTPATPATVPPRGVRGALPQRAEGETPAIGTTGPMDATGTAGSAGATGATAPSAHAAAAAPATPPVPPQRPAAPPAQMERPAPAAAHPVGPTPGGKPQETLRPPATGPGTPGTHSAARGAAPRQPAAAGAGTTGSARRPARPVGQASRQGPSAPPQPAPVARRPGAAAQVSRHASRAVRREFVEPAHPMARLLAGAGDAALVSPERNDGNRPPEAPPAPPARGAAPATPSDAISPDETAPHVAPEVRTVHVAEPEPEPEINQPATLEALAARFSHRHERPAHKEQAKADRSRKEREKQAAILARLREQAARSGQ